MAHPNDGPHKWADLVLRVPLGSICPQDAQAVLRVCEDLDVGRRWCLAVVQEVDRNQHRLRDGCQLGHARRQNLLTAPAGNDEIPGAEPPRPARRVLPVHPLVTLTRGVLNRRRHKIATNERIPKHHAVPPSTAVFLVAQRPIDKEDQLRHAASSLERGVTRLSGALDGDVAHFGRDGASEEPVFLPPQGKTRLRLGRRRPTGTTTTTVGRGRGGTSGTKAWGRGKLLLTLRPALVTGEETGWLVMLLLLLLFVVRGVDVNQRRRVIQLPSIIVHRVRRMGGDRGGEGKGRLARTRARGRGR